ncbi:sigma-54-dependent transcriptional regulator [Bacillus sp. FJAT-27251]|uniref:PrpR N-terminal domain-containing protein n=1 Tax=Bacillus sp. FJAT-27251 TaxID=1684142 RepID=UPI0006A79CC3|nr:sigma-54-dependent transcriptional regulator [Bacillus sp. FJAT-27251]
MIKALAIVPYEGLYEMMKEVTQEVDDIQLHIELGNLHEGAAIAREAEHEGYHVIISRGGTASLIQEAVSIPVIDIQVSGYDVLRILTLVKGFSRKAAIVGFSNITHGASTICKLLDFDIETLTITKETEVKEILSGLKKLDCEVVIGDVVTVQAARELGLTGVLITSGKEAIFDAFEQTRRSYRIYSRLQQDVSFYKHLLDCGGQIIAVMDQEENLVYANGTFYKEFQWGKLRNLPGMKQLLQESLITNEKIAKTLHLNEGFWNISACTMDRHTIIMMDKTNSNQENGRGDDSDLNAIELHMSVPYIPLTGKSEVFERVLKQIDEYSSMKDPVWILGEKGNGKSVAAHSIYLKREPGNGPFIILHGERLKRDQLKDLLNEDFFHKYSNGVLFLKNIDKMNSYLQKELHGILQLEGSKKLKWLVSSRDDIAEKVNSGEFNPDLYHSLAALTIHIPPLRQRRQDIEDLVHVFISELHPKYGNGVVGIRQDALDELVHYDWPGNVEQLRQVIEQLFLQSHAYYIEKDKVMDLFNQLEQQDKQNDALTPVDLSGTLEDIEKQVIAKVLEEEGLNQSKAAKRLGINRSTLWRKLKE